MNTENKSTELPLQLLSAVTPRGNVRHLVNVETGDTRTLCGRVTQINPRHLFIGTWRAEIGPAEQSNCNSCRKVAATIED